MKHQVWLFTAWGTPVRLVSPLIGGDVSSATSHVVQVEAGWDYIAVLTASGSVYTEWPWGGVLKNKLEQHVRELELQKVVVPAQDGVIHCKTWELHHDLLELPPIPSDLPSISPLTSDVDELGNNVEKEERRLVKIAGGEGFLIGLTNEGHVLRIDFNIDYEDQDLSRLRDAFRRRTCQWEYVRLVKIRFLELDSHFRQKCDFVSFLILVNWSAYSNTLCSLTDLLSWIVAAILT